MKKTKFDALSTGLFINEIRATNALAHGFVVGTADGACSWRVFAEECDLGEVEEGVLDLLRKNKDSQLIGAFAVKASKRPVIALHFRDGFHELPQKSKNMLRQKVLNCAVEYIQREKTPKRALCADVEYVERGSIVVPARKA